MNDNIKSRLIHAGQVFVASFLSLVSAVLIAGAPVNWTLNFWIPIIISAVSAGVKTLSDPQIPTALGGTKRV